MTTVDSEKIARVVDLVLSPGRMFVLDKGTGESILCLEGLVRLLDLKGELPMTNTGIYAGNAPRTGRLLVKRAPEDVSQAVPGYTPVYFGLSDKFEWVWSSYPFEWGDKNVGCTTEWLDAELNEFFDSPNMVPGDRRVIWIKLELDPST